MQLMSGASTILATLLRRQSFPTEEILFDCPLIVFFTIVSFPALTIFFKGHAIFLFEDAQGRIDLLKR